MRLFKRFLLGLLIFTVVIGKSASAETLLGQITDTLSQPVSWATVSIEALDRSTQADSAGMYQFDRVPRGIYTVSFSAVGYSTAITTIEIVAGENRFDVILQSRVSEMGGVTVTATPQASDVLNSPQSVTVIDSDQLRQKRGESLGETISDAPGVTTVTTGSAVSKPMIRGLTSQRVLVISDGVRQEGQQWGDEHGPEIDPLQIESVEIVRGPGSVLYGSDALGGIVNVITKEPPSSHRGDPLFSGEVQLDGFTGNEQTAEALALQSAYRDIGIRGSFSHRNSSDVNTPSGTLFNSGEKSTSGSAAFGIHNDRIAMDIDYQRFDQTLEIHEDPAEDPNATPFQEVTHDRVHVHLHLPSKPIRFEFDGGWQRNQRKEFEESGAVEPELYLDLTTLTGDLKAHHVPIGKVFGTLGLSVMSQQNKSKAEEKLIPEYENTDISGYLFEQYNAEEMTISLGARVDQRRLDVMRTEGDDFLVDAQSLTYTSFSGTAGIVYHVRDDAALALNIGRAWRAPTVFELFVNGVHEGTNRFEIGRSDLKPERSLSIDGSFRLASEQIQGELSVYVNMVEQFTYLNPTGEVDTASGSDIYEIQQDDATLSGMEAIVHVIPIKWLRFSVGADLVRGNLDATSADLPLMPADRARAKVRFMREWTDFGLRDGYLELEAIGVTRQERVAEFESASPGYGLFNLSAGCELGGVNVDAGVKNLFDKSYRDHLSRYRDYADNPGISLYCKVTSAFELAD